MIFAIPAVSLSQNIPTAATASVSPVSVFSGGASPSTLSALVSQHRLLELSRFGLRGYDLAQHMLTQQGAVSKLLGKKNIKKRLFHIHKVELYTAIGLKLIKCQ